MNKKIVVRSFVSFLKCFDGGNSSCRATAYGGCARGRQFVRARRETGRRRVPWIMEGPARKIGRSSAGPGPFPWNPPQRRRRSSWWLPEGPSPRILLTRACIDGWARVSPGGFQAHKASSRMAAGGMEGCDFGNQNVHLTPPLGRHWNKASGERVVWVRCLGTNHILPPVRATPTEVVIQKE